MLIDGSSLVFRAYYGALARARVSGTDGNAVGGFLDRLARLVTDRRPGRLVVAEDWAWRPQWRVDLIADYKAHRVSEPVPPGLVAHLPVITELLGYIGIDVVGVADYEAEDVIATLTRLAAGTVEIASGDRDLFALVEDPRVRVLYSQRSGLAVIDEREITRRYAIPGRRYADFAILRGDPSDGLPGLRGVGAVTAAAMIRRHGDIVGVLRDRPLLALLAKEASHAYQLRARLALALGPLADALNEGQVYVTLTRLEKAGLVSSARVGQADRPDRKVYELTDAGRDRVMSWLEDVSWPKPAPAEFHLKLVAAAAAGLADPVGIVDLQRRE